jgi:hypothetical protein
MTSAAIFKKVRSQHQLLSADFSLAFRYTCRAFKINGLQDMNNGSQIASAAPPSAFAYATARLAPQETDKTVAFCTAL